jgi:myo-inositol-1(or 4)-monophosphatase
VTHFANRAFTLRAIGSAALAIAWLAAGRLDAYLNYSLYAWDFAAGQLLVEEAGGLLTGLQGEKLNCLTREASSCLLSNTLIHHELQTLIETAETL